MKQIIRIWRKINSRTIYLNLKIDIFKSNILYNNPAICASFLTLLVECYTCSGERWAENRTTEEEERRAEEGAGAPPRTDGCQAHHPQVRSEVYHPQVRKELGLPSSDDPGSSLSGEEWARITILRREVSQVHHRQVSIQPGFPSSGEEVTRVTAFGWGVG